MTAKQFYRQSVMGLTNRSLSLFLALLLCTSLSKVQCDSESDENLNDHTDHDHHDTANHMHGSRSKFSRWDIFHEIASNSTLSVEKLEVFIHEVLENLKCDTDDVAKECEEVMVCMKKESQ